MAVTQAIIVRTMFSTDLGAAADIVNRTWPIINRRIGETFWSTWLETALPLPANRRFWRALRDLETVVYRIIADRRRSGRDEADLLSMFLSARDEETGAGMNDRQLRDEVMTMLLAGHETTSLALSWTYHLLTRHPGVERSIEAEVDRVIGRARPAIEHLERLTCTRRAIDESLRLYPPAWGFSRQALGDDEIGGYHVPKGSLVFLIPFVVHRRPTLWPDPERFDPDCFAPEAGIRAPAIRLPAVRRRPARLHRQPLRDDGSAAHRRRHRAAVSHRGPARPGDPAGAAHHAAAVAWHSATLARR